LLTEQVECQKKKQKNEDLNGSIQGELGSSTQDKGETLKHKLRLDLRDPANRKESYCIITDGNCNDPLSPRDRLYLKGDLCNNHPNQPPFSG
jgi:hypothetical protein